MSAPFSVAFVRMQRNAAVRSNAGQIMHGQSGFDFHDCNCLNPNWPTRGAAAHWTRAVGRPNNLFQGTRIPRAVRLAVLKNAGYLENEGHRLSDSSLCSAAILRL